MKKKLQIEISHYVASKLIELLEARIYDYVKRICGAPLKRIGGKT